jgi:hypothetical protein
MNFWLQSESTNCSEGSDLSLGITLSQSARGPEKSRSLGHHVVDQAEKIRFVHGLKVPESFVVHSRCRPLSPQGNR